jgi:hypothetical protein
VFGGGEKIMILIEKEELEELDVDGIIILPWIDQPRGLVVRVSDY